MTRRPDISIVVCTYNRATSLQLTLAALAAQVTPTSIGWEVVVVDNNSTDATRTVVRSFVASAAVHTQYVFVAQQGLSRARNAGLAASRGDVIAFTDDDVEPATDWVSRIATVMTHTETDIVGGRILPVWSRVPPAWLQHRPALHGALAIMDHTTAVQIVDARSAPSVWGANMAFRRCVFEEVGVFDTRRGLIGTTLHRGEEIDLVARSLAAGRRAVYDPTVLVWHRISPERMRLRYLSQLYFQRAEGDAIVQPPTGGVPFGVPLHAYRLAAGTIAAWLASAARRRPDTIERWLDCCAALGSMWGARRSRRRASA